MAEQGAGAPTQAPEPSQFERDRAAAQAVGQAAPPALPPTIAADTQEAVEEILNALEQGAKKAAMAQSGAEFKDYAAGIHSLSQAIAGKDGLAATAQPDDPVRDALIEHAGSLSAG